MSCFKQDVNNSTGKAWFFKTWPGFISIIIPAMFLGILIGCEDNAEPRQQTPDAPPAALIIRPSFAAISSSNTYATFEVSGGTPPYQWDISDKSLGTIPDAYSPVATYTRKSLKGVNVISVMDRNRWFAEATIYQE